MKKLAFAVLLVSFLFGCKDEKAKSTTANTSTKTETKKSHSASIDFECKTFFKKGDYANLCFTDIALPEHIMGSGCIFDFKTKGDKQEQSIKVQIAAQLELAKLVGDKATKRAYEPPVENEEIKAKVKAIVSTKIYDVAKSFLNKADRKTQFKAVKEELIETITEQEGEEFMEENTDLVKTYFGKIQKEVIREMVMAESIRLDGRQLDQVRPIWTEVDYLPSAHGSAIFNRGETQSLTSLTLGTKLDQLMIDTALLNGYERFILHYNFPAYSVGETKPMRGPGRREVGHANLASRSLKKVLPDENPYTIRIVSDILESNGSSSMATVCAGSLALMDAGINIKAVTSTFDIYRAFGIAADIGLSYHNPETNLTVGIVAKHMGSVLNSYTTTNESLPFDFQIGLSKRFKHLPFRLSITAHQLQQWQLRLDEANPQDQISFLGGELIEQSQFIERWVVDIINIDEAVDIV